MKDRPKTIWPQTNEPITECRKCKAKIFFYFNKGTCRYMPVNATEPDKGVSHFATCTNPDDFRKPKTVQSKLL